MSSKKSIQKCIRLSEEVFGYIDKAEGKGFNEKFENIILLSQRDEKRCRESLDMLNKQIEAKRKQLHEIGDKIVALDHVYMLRWKILEIESEIDDLIKEDSS